LGRVVLVFTFQIGGGGVCNFGLHENGKLSLFLGS